MCDGLQGGGRSRAVTLPDVPAAGDALVIGSQHPLDLIRRCSVVADKQDTHSSSL